LLARTRVSYLFATTQRPKRDGLCVITAIQSIYIIYQVCCVND